MSTINTTLGFLAYNDQKPGNNPNIRVFDLKYDLLGQPGDQPLSQDLVIPPMTSKTVFSGIRTVATDGTTEISVSFPYPTLNTYRFSWTGGTNPLFRTDRAVGVSDSTQAEVTLNGSVAQFIMGTFAQATDTLDTPNIDFQALSIGTSGNSISLVFDGVYATATDSVDSPNITFTADNAGVIGNDIVLVFNGGKAFYVDTLDTPNIVFTAVEGGSIGNSITLSFDGHTNVFTVCNSWNLSNPFNQVDFSGLGNVVPAAQVIQLSGGGPITVDEVVTAWNTLNPTNQVSYTGLGTVIPTPQNIMLSGGSGSTIDSIVSAWNTSNPSNKVSYTGLPTVVPVAQTINLSGGSFLSLGSVLVGDIMRIDSTAGFSPNNTGDFTIIGVTGSTISIINPNAIVEDVTLMNTANHSFLIYSNGAASNQPQIGDNVVISAGFSPATWGTYQLIEVTSFWFDVSIIAPGGIPIETNIEPGVSGMVFYSSAKLSVLVAAQDKCSVRLNGDTTDNNLLEPVEAGNPQRPALFYKQGTAYSVVINNLSINSLSVLVATVE